MPAPAASLPQQLVSSRLRQRMASPLNTCMRSVSRYTPASRAASSIDMLRPKSASLVYEVLKQPVPMQKTLVGQFVAVVTVSPGTGQLYSSRKTSQAPVPALVCAQVDVSGVQPVATSGAHWSEVTVLEHDIVLWYSQQARVTETPSMILADGPSTQTGEEATEQRPPAPRVGHWLFHVSVKAESAVALV